MASLFICRYYVICMQWANQSQMKFMHNSLFLLFFIECDATAFSKWISDWIIFQFFLFFLCRRRCCCCWCCVDEISSGKIAVVGVSEIVQDANEEHILNLSFIAFPHSRRMSRCFSWFAGKHIWTVYTYSFLFTSCINFFLFRFCLFFVVAAAAVN